MFYASQLQGFRDLGHVEGRTLVFEQIFTAERYERFNENAAALVAHNADVLVAVTRSATIAAQRTTVTTPIVFTVVRRNIDEAQKVAKQLNIVVEPRADFRVVRSWTPMLLNGSMPFDTFGS